ncbi:MAG TPA: RNA polymerase sigma factor [Flavobacteriales bacterium]|nr:RNA polymerase sigma factor [Flavobacteriales bacterium]HNU55092.1 RNA polymerase sigma factor [Flavobacteriales bacterium]
MSTHEFNDQLVRSQRGLFHYALSLTHDAERARDLVQDSFLKALSNRDKFKHGTDLKAWLTTITRNQFINGYRRQRLSRTLEGDIDRPGVANASGPDHDPIAGMDARKATEYLERMRPMFREPFKLFQDGFRYQEIAEKVGVPLGTVKSRIHQARQELMAVMGGSSVAV